jgi:hypothetical protein
VIEPTFIAMSLVSLATAVFEEPLLLRREALRTQEEAGARASAAPHEAHRVMQG